jgi:hypothetical protein
MFWLNNIGTRRRTAAASSMAVLRVGMFAFLFATVLVPRTAQAFVPQVRQSSPMKLMPTSTSTVATIGYRVTSSNNKKSGPTPLSMANVKISTPSPDEAAQMGIRDWPQQFKKQGEWTEFVAADTTVVRYILDGTGSLKSTDEDGANTQTTPLAPGTLVEVTGSASLQFSAVEDMLVLTPGFEEGGLLLGVAALVIVLFGGLLVTGGSF